MASIKLYELNSDILYEILLSCSSLSDLYGLIRTHPNIYHAFNVRRRLVVRSVFSHSVLCGKKWQNKIDQNEVDAFFKGLQCKNPIDHVAMREAVWHHYNLSLRAERSMKPATSLLKWYQKARLQKDAFQFASKTLKTVLRKPSSATPDTQDFVRTVAHIYSLENRTQDMIHMLQATLKRLPPVSSKHIFWVKQLINTYRAGGATYSQPLLDLLRANWERYSATPNGASTDDAKYLARELVTSYNALSDDAAALAIARTIRDATPPGTPEHIAWSRHMMRLHRKAHDDAGALQVLQDAWRPLHHGSKFYRPWSDELSRQYEAVGRPQDAIATWEAAWAAFAHEAEGHPHQPAWRFDAKGAALSLVKLYRRYERVGEAAALEARCRDLGIVL